MTPGNYRMVSLTSCVLVSKFTCSWEADEAAESPGRTRTERRNERSDGGEAEC